jgi:predicted nucleotidyltransferase
MARADVSEIVREVNTGLRTIYGSRLEGCYLYGSYARGEEKPGSDLDILVVLSDYDSYYAELRRTSHLISDLSLHYDITLSQAFLRRAEWLSGDNPFLQNVREEAIPA